MYTIVVTYDRYQSDSDIIFCKKEDRLEMMSNAINANNESLREHSEFSNAQVVCRMQVFIRQMYA